MNARTISRLKRICIFYMEMRNGSDQRKAQQAQLNYVKEHPEYLEAYNEIYH